MHYCCVKLCRKNTKTSGVKKDGISFHRFPKCKNLKQIWIDATKRPDDWFPSPTSVICSRHFKSEYITTGNRRLLCNNAVPTLHLPTVVSEDGSVAERRNTFSEVAKVTQTLPTTGICHEATQHQSSVTMNMEVVSAVVPMPMAGDTVENGTTEESPVVVKQEIEDSFSVHEEDIEEQLEIRKRRMKSDSDHVEVKRTKEEEEEPSKKEVIPEVNPVEKSNPIENPKKVVTFDGYPVDFMKSVLNSQNEILSVLKSQVLLENPDMELIKFLRLVGAKLSRLTSEDRRKMQNAIVKLMDGGCETLP